MATSVVMPKMGESITEGTVLRWLKKVGEQVQKDEPILEISTDKVDTEVPSPVAGTLLKILASENETVSVGAPIAEIGQNGEAASAAPAAQPASTNQPQSAPQSAETQSPRMAEEQAAAPSSAPSVTTADAQSAPEPQSGGGAEQAVVMPKMGESISEGTVLRWLKKEGEKVEKDEPILEISTDKVDTEVPAPFAGTLTKILAKEGETVAVGATIAQISGGSGAAAASPKAAAPQTSTQQAPPQQQATQAAPQAQSAPQAQAAPSAAPQQSFGSTPAGRTSGGRFYSPLVRTIAKEEGVSREELDTIQGSGLEGRVTKSDIQSYLQNRGGRPAAQAAQASGSQQSAPQQSAQQQSAGFAPAPQSSARVQPVSYPLPAAGTFASIPMDNIRQRIAEHMVRSKHTSAHVTSVTEVDVTNIVNFRTKNKDEFKRREGVNLTYTPIFIECMVRALKEFPVINSSVDGNNIIMKRDINFGVAVGLPQVEGSPLPPALIVPVIKQADKLNLSGIAHAVADLAAKARSKKLSPDDISGGTFTLTNPGMYGNLFGTPIINQPQVAIMTVGAIVKRVVVMTDPEGNDYMAIRSMMFLGLSYDHRIIDGMYGVQFTDRVKQYMEQYQGQV